MNKIIYDTRQFGTPARLARRAKEARRAKMIENLKSLAIVSLGYLLLISAIGLVESIN
jgi:hypothetical protein